LHFLPIYGKMWVLFERKIFMWEQYKAYLFEIIKITVISAAIIIPVRMFLMHPFIVKGVSMEETFHNNDYLIVNRWTYRFDEPQRGDVIVFRSPQGPKDHLIKRVIGLPGETVTIKNNEVFITNDDFPEGRKLDETEYLEDSDLTYPEGIYQIQDDYYFVMGDNRAASMDSRRFGPVHKSLIVGHAWVRGWPFEDAQTFNPILYPQGL